MKYHRLFAFCAVLAALGTSCNIEDVTERGDRCPVMYSYFYGPDKNFCAVHDDGSYSGCDVGGDKGDIDAAMKLMSCPLKFQQCFQDAESLYYCAYNEVTCSGNKIFCGGSCIECDGKCEQGSCKKNATCGNGETLCGNECLSADKLIDGKCPSVCEKGELYCGDKCIVCSGTCGEDGSCVEQTSGDANGNLMQDKYEPADPKTCVTHADCGDGNICEILVINNSYQKRCMPKCTSDAQCVEGYKCRNTDGRCAATAFTAEYEVSSGQTVGFYLSHDFKDMNTLESKLSVNLDFFEFTVDWGDGTKETFNQESKSDITHTYEFEPVSEGEKRNYKVQITGNYPHLMAIPFDVKKKETGGKVWGYSCGIKTIRSFGTVGIGAASFLNCQDLGAISAVDIPDSTLMTSLYMTFAIADSTPSGVKISNELFNGNIARWDTSHVEKMRMTFLNNSEFNDNITLWDTSSVTDMSFLFKSAGYFNRDIENWNVGKVSAFQNMFNNAALFNSDLGNWNTENAVEMHGMFSGAKTFNKNISQWNTAKVTNMSYMFKDAVKFNQDIGKWKVSNVTNMSGMFSGAITFNQNIGDWDVSSVKDMSNMFSAKVTTDLALPNDSDIKKNCKTGFNQNIGAWDTSRVENMNHMFYCATSFNQNIGAWDTSSVKDMNHMFFNASTFNQDISAWNTENVTSLKFMFAGAAQFNSGGNEPGTKAFTWNTSKVTDMANMFNDAFAFNQNIGTWKTFNVKDLSDMFNGAAAFNQNIDQWDVSNARNMSGMFKGASAFNQNLSIWTVDNVIDMSCMFCNAKSYDQVPDFKKLNDKVVVDNIFKSSGITESTYCDVLVGTIWNKYLDKLGIDYECYKYYCNRDECSTIKGGTAEYDECLKTCVNRYLGKCNSDADCKSGEICNAVTMSCEVSEKTCTKDADCKSGEICNAETGVCDPDSEKTPECESSVDCKEGYVCESNKCVPKAD